MAEEKKEKVNSQCLGELPEDDDQPPLIEQLEEVAVLHLAASQGRTDVVKTVIDQILQAVSPSSGMGAGHRPQIMGSQSEEEQAEAEERRKRLAGVSLNEVLSSKRQEDGATALHLAAQNGHVDVVRALLRSGADPQTEGTGGKFAGLTAFQIAKHNDECKQAYVQELFQQVALGSTDRVGSLIAAGVDPREPWVNDGTALLEKPLHWAASFGQQKLVKLLCEEGSEINCCNEEGATPLHEAARAGNTATVSLLLSLGASVLQRGISGYSRGKTPQEVAKNEETRSLFPQLPDQDQMLEGRHQHKTLPPPQPQRIINKDAFPLLWPPPRDVWRLEGSIVAVSQCSQLIAVGSEETNLALEIVKNALFTRGISTEVNARQTQKQNETTNNETETPTFTISLGVDPHLCIRKQQYRLSVMPAEKGGISIRAHDSAGLFYGAQTFCQLMDFYCKEEHDDGFGSKTLLPECLVMDWPAIPIRATKLCITSGRFPSQAYALSIVELWAKARINQVHLSLEPSVVKRLLIQNTVASEEETNGLLQPEAEVSRSRYQDFSLKSFKSYCSQHHVEVIPHISLEHLWHPDIRQQYLSLFDGKAVSIEACHNTDVSVSKIISDLIASGFGGSIFLSNISEADIMELHMLQVSLCQPLALSLVEDFIFECDQRAGDSFCGVPASFIRCGHYQPLGLNLSLCEAFSSLVHATSLAASQQICFLLCPFPLGNLYFPPSFAQLLEFLSGGLSWNCSSTALSEAAYDKLSQQFRGVLFKHLFNLVEQTHHHAAVNYICDILFTKEILSTDLQQFTRLNPLPVESLLWALHLHDTAAFNSHPDILYFQKIKDVFRRYANLLAAVPPGMFTLLGKLRFQYRPPPTKIQEKIRSPALELELGSRLLSEIPLGLEFLKVAALTLCRVCSAVASKNRGSSTAPFVFSFESVAEISNGVKSDLANEILDLYEALSIHLAEVFECNGLRDECIKYCTLTLNLLMPNEDFTKMLDGLFLFQK